MAITETRALPAKFIEELGTDYAGQLKAATAKPLPTSSFAPSVAGQTALQQQATALTGSGIGSYQPFLTQARPNTCLLYTSPSPRDGLLSRMPSSA